MQSAGLFTKRSPVQSYGLISGLPLSMRVDACWYPYVTDLPEQGGSIVRTLLRRCAPGLAMALLLVSTLAFFSATPAFAAHAFAFTTFELGDFNAPGAQIGRAH